MRALSSARVVVLDGDPDHRNFLCSALSLLGIARVQAATSIDEVRAIDPAPDICVVDTRRLSGFVGGQRVPRSPFESTSMSCILIVDVVNADVVKAVSASGYSAVLSAPVAPRLLYRRIGSMLQKARRAGRRIGPDVVTRPANVAALQDA